MMAGNFFGKETGEFILKPHFSNGLAFSSILFYLFAFEGLVFGVGGLLLLQDFPLFVCVLLPIHSALPL